MKIIPLTKGKFAIVDDDDFHKVNNFKWYFCISRKGSGYAQRGTRKGGTNKK